jgi:hypothetical protein
LIEFTFIVYLDLVRFSFCEFGVGVFFVGERIDWSIIQTSSGNTASEYLEYSTSYGSLVPENSSRESDRKGIVRSRIVSSSNDTQIKRFGNLCNISNSCGITGLG